MLGTHGSVEMNEASKPKFALSSSMKFTQFSMAASNGDPKAFSGAGYERC